MCHVGWLVFFLFVHIEERIQTNNNSISLFSFRQVEQEIHIWLHKNWFITRNAILKFYVVQIAWYTINNTTQSSYLKLCCWLFLILPFDKFFWTGSTFHFSTIPSNWNARKNLISLVRVTETATIVRFLNFIGLVESDRLQDMNDIIDSYSIIKIW